MNTIKKVIYLYWSLFKNIHVRDYSIYCSIDKKREFIKKTQQSVKLKNFMESGTYIGDTIDYLKSDFEKIYSIELSNKLYLDAVSRFDQQKNIVIINGDSGVIIKDILSKIDDKSFFWLDGHYSSGITAKGSLNTPIMNELEIILKHRKDHLIFIDDARLFIGVGDYPWLPKLKSFVDQLSNNNYNLNIENDIICLIPKR